MASLNPSSIVLYKPRKKRSKSLSNKQKSKYASLSPLEIDPTNISDSDSENDHFRIQKYGITNLNDTVSKHSSKNSKRSLFSRSKKSKLSQKTHSKSSKKSQEKSKSKSHRSIKSLTKSISRHRRRLQRQNKSRGERKENEYDHISKSSKSFSVKTFYRNRRAKQRHKNNNSISEMNNNNQNRTYSVNSNISVPFQTASGASNNWRCDQCNYFLNSAMDPHCHKCGAINDVNQKRNYSQTRNSTRDTTSSLPMIAPGQGSSMAAHSSNTQNILLHHSSDSETHSGTFSTTDSSETDTDSETHSSMDDEDGKAIVVEDYRSKTSQTRDSQSQRDGDDAMNIDNGDMKIEMVEPIIKTDIPALPALPTVVKSENRFQSTDSYDSEYDDDTESSSSSDLNGMCPTNVVDTTQSYRMRNRGVSLSVNDRLSSVINAFHSYRNTRHKRYMSPKLEEWNAFQWNLGFKRFILAVLYFIVTVEEAFMLVYIKWYWLPLPLLLCLSYLLLIVYIGKFNCVKYSRSLRICCLCLFYFINTLVIIGPCMNVLIASSKVYDFRDILGRDMRYNQFMWVCFAVAIVAMVFIDIIIVHNGGSKHNKSDKYRVETFKLAVVKDEEYVLNNQCLWYSVPREDWGKANQDKNDKNKNQTNNVLKEGGVIHNKRKKDTKSSFFVRIGLGKKSTEKKKLDESERAQTGFVNNSESESSDSSESSDHDRNDIEHRNEICDSDRQSHSITNMINDSKNENRLYRRCCTKPFSCAQWLLIVLFFVSLQTCVVFSILDAKEIEKFDLGPPKS